MSYKTLPDAPATAITYEEEYGGYGKKLLVTHLGITKREQLASTILAGLVAKYTMNAPEDQDTVCQLAVELADNLIKHLNNDY